MTAQELHEALRACGFAMTSAEFEGEADAVCNLHALLFGEITPDDIVAEPMLQLFQWGHLPPALQARSAPFGRLALHIARTTPRNPERTVALRKLREAKDAGVTAFLWKQPTPPDSNLDFRGSSAEVSGPRKCPCGGTLNAPSDMLQRLAKCQVCGQVVDLALPEPTPSKVTK